MWGTSGKCLSLRYVSQLAIRSALHCHFGLSFASLDDTATQRFASRTNFLENLSKIQIFRGGLLYIISSIHLNEL
jgi:hypothetical protein